MPPAPDTFDTGAIKTLLLLFFFKYCPAYICLPLTVNGAQSSLLPDRRQECVFFNVGPYTGNAHEQ